VETATDPVCEFFRGLAERGREPLLQNVSGTLRFDLVDGEGIEHWYLTIKNGDVAVSHKDAEADALIRTAKVLFEGITTGRVNAMAAALRAKIRRPQAALLSGVRPIDAIHFVHCILRTHCVIQNIV